MLHLMWVNKKLFVCFFKKGRKLCLFFIKVTSGSAPSPWLQFLFLGTEAERTVCVCVCVYAVRTSGHVMVWPISSTFQLAAKLYVYVMVGHWEEGREGRMLEVGRTTEMNGWDVKTGERSKRDQQWKQCLKVERGKGVEPEGEERW